MQPYKYNQSLTKTVFVGSEPNSPDEPVEQDQPVSSTPVPTQLDAETNKAAATDIAVFKHELAQIRTSVHRQNVDLTKMESKSDNILGQSIPDLVKLISANELVIINKIYEIINY